MSGLSGKRVFVVADDACRGESQFFLLHLLRNLREAGAVIELFCWRGGGLLDEYKKVAATRDLDDLNRWVLARVFERLRLRRVSQALKSLRLRWWLRSVSSADVGYLSGGEAARICGFLSGDGPAIVTHLHGNRTLPERDRSTIIDRTDRFVVSSDETWDDLVSAGVSPDDIERQDYLLIIDALSLSTDVPPTRGELGIPDDAVVVAGAGTADWWAAPDPFVLLAWDVLQTEREIDPWFLWIAPESGERELWPLRHDIDNAGVGANMVVVDSPASIDALAVADVFVLATREDCHVRLTIEAARSAMPVVRTDGVGMVLGDGPVVVPYLDGQQLAATVTELVDDRDRRAELGQAAADACAKVHDTESGVVEVAALLASSVR